MPSRSHALLVARLDLDIRTLPICLPCLSFVSFPLDDGDLAQAAREARSLTPDIWAEGLAEPALEAVRRAREAGVAGAEAALEELERSGGRSRAAQEIVLRLADDLNRWTRTELRLASAARDRPEEAPPELN